MAGLLRRGPYDGPYTTTLDSVHELTHQGRCYSAHVYGSLGSAEAGEIALTLPAGVKCHLLLQCSSEKLGLLTVIEDVTSLSGGTTFTPANQNRNSSRTAEVTCKTGLPAGALTYGGGTVIHAERITTGGRGGYTQWVHEMMLLSEATTVLRFVAGTASCDMSLHAVWYEPPR